MDEETRNETTRVFELQRANRWTLKKSSTAQRLERLGRFRVAVEAHADEVAGALYEDLRRTPDGSRSLEVEVLLNDIDHTLAHLAEWMSSEPVPSSSLLPSGAMSDQYATQFIQYEARGVVLIFGSWNAPFMLTLQPLVAAMAAGNTAIVRPNEWAPASGALITRMIEEACAEADVAVIAGDVEVANALLELPVDHIFFTGSPAVARIVGAAAAKTLTSTTMELGGKSPAIVDSTTDLATTARVIAAGKYWNAGQICITPDHVWIEANLRDEFVEHYMAFMQARVHPAGVFDPEGLTRMVNARAFDRVTGYLDDALARGATLVGTGASDRDTLMIEPGVLIDVPWDSAIMQNEIFGPLLPVLTYTSLDQVLERMQGADKPLSMYPFTTDEQTVQRILAETSSGGVTVNGWASHAFDSHLPFGGIGTSGSGHYRGIHGFRDLSHARAVTRFPAPFDSGASA